MSLGDINSLDHTVLLCEQLETTKAFYRDVLEFTIEVDREHWVSFRIGATLLTLRPRTKWAVCDDGEKIAGSASVQLAFWVPPASFDGCYNDLRSHNVPILREPTDLPDWRHRTVFFRDPEDNVIEIYAEI